MDTLQLSLVIGFCLALWVYFDAKEKNLSAGFWAFGTFLIAIIVFPCYLIERNKVKKVTQQSDEALEIARMRFAKGEITEREFEEIRYLLERSKEKR